MRTWQIYVLAIVLTAATIPLAVMDTTITLIAIAAVAALIVATVAIRRGIRSTSLTGDRILSIPLVLLPLALGVRTFNPNVAILFLILLGLISLAQGRNRGTGASFPMAGPIIASLLIVFFRPASPSDAVIAFLSVLIVVGGLRRAPGILAVDSLVDGVGIYLVANVALHLAGVTSPGSALRLGGLGEAGALRVIFPLANSLNQPPAMAAIFIGGAVLVFWRASAKRKTFLVAGLAASVYIIFAAGTRSSLFAVAVPVVVLLLPAAARRVGALLTAIFAVSSAWILPVLIGTVVPVVAWVSSVAPTLIRDSVITPDNALNGREVIWSRGIQYFVERDPTQQLIGFGQNGQIDSGASNTYAWIFGSSLANPLSASLHNSFLQQLYDGGWLGFVAMSVFAMAAAWLWGTASRSGDLRAVAGVSMVAVALLLSATEVSISPGYSQESFWVFLALALASAELNSKRKLTFLSSGQGGRSGGPVDDHDTLRRYARGHAPLLDNHRRS